MNHNLTETHSARLLSVLIAPHVVQGATMRQSAGFMCNGRKWTWVCEKGDVRGIGATPQEAAFMFDAAWTGAEVTR
jgi:hypothetical protein